MFQSDTTTTTAAASDNTLATRKQIKAKAVEAMAKDGVDISQHRPKTIAEILPFFILLTTENKEVVHHHHVDHDVVGAQPITPPKPPNGSSLRILEKDKLLATTTDEGKNDGDEPPTKPLGKFIVLCSCGDELKYELSRRSKSVEEWSLMLLLLPSGRR